MKTLSTPIKQIIQARSVEMFLLIETKAANVTSLPYDILMSNGIDYVSGGAIKSAEPPRQTAVVDREAYKISFIDVSGVYRSLFDSGIVGSDATVTMGFINKGVPIAGSDGIIVPHDEPFRDIRDTLRVYKGKVDTTSIDIDAVEGTQVAVIECSSPMAALDRRNTFVTSKEAMRARYPNDSAFDRIHVGSSESSLKWGKI